MKHLLIYSLFLYYIFSCTPKKSDSCAEVEVFIPSSGSNKIYTLKVEVKNDKLIKIYWPNGGWLDEDHFTPPNISRGEARFKDDRNREFKVELIHNSNCDG